MRRSDPAPRGRVRLLSWAPALTLLLLLGPVLAGLAGTLAPAFGWLPALGGNTLSLEPWRALFATPGIAESIRLSVTTGLLATSISLTLVVLICSAWQGTRAFTLIQRSLSPLLSVPHAAAAFGLAFLIAPSGWIARAVSPWLSGWQQPPDWLITQDPAGLALVAGLVVKEVPFLFLMTLAALGQADARRSRTVALSLGYGPVAAWIKTVLPRVYPQIRLPVYAVLAYSMSVVDIAIILGPTTPPPLAVQLLVWMRDPDLNLWFKASAGALVQLLLVIAALGLWHGAEVLIAHFGRRWIEAGARGRDDGPLRWLAALAATLIALSVMLGLAGLMLWSVAGPWSFPELLPHSLSLHTWQRQAEALTAPIIATLAIGIPAVLLALVLSIGSLEAEQRHGLHPGTRALWLLYLPLLMPQVGFLFGLQILTTALGLDRGWTALVLAHLVFVLPYLYLSLADPYRAWDRRYGVIAGALGASPDRVLWSVRLPMLLAPILTATAVAFAVSVGQYLPTLLMSGGRVATLTTEAVALASGGNRRLIGVYALLQMLLPLLGFSLALALPALAFRHRKGMINTP